MEKHINFQNSFIVAEFFEDWDEYADIYCACGHVTNRVELDLYTGVEATVEEKKYHCEACGNNELKLLLKNNFNHFPNHVAVYNNGDKISLDMKVGSYFLHNEHNKIVYKDSSYRITFNVHTGNFYLIKGRTVRNVTFGKLPLDFANVYSTIRYSYQDTIKEYIFTCLAARGVKYVTSKSQYGIFDLFDYAVYAKYPQLQNMEDISFTYMPKKFRKKLKDATTRTELNKVFFNTNAKKVYQELSNEIAIEKADSYLTIHVLGEVLKKSENMVKLLQCKRTLKTSPPFVLGESQKRGGTFEKSLRLGGANLDNIFSNYEFDNDFADIPRYIAAFNFFIKQLTENVFVNRIIRELNSDDEKTKNFYYSNHIYQVLLDTHEMLEKIYRKEPNYRVRWNKWSFHRIHDTVAKDLERYADENEAIEYTEKECTFNKTFANGIEIKLAPDTETMIKNGSAMNICVGGYTHRALTKKRLYAFLYKNGKAVACMSLNPYRNNALEEAKAAHNELPESEIAHAIREWCETNRFNWKYCSDLMFAKAPLAVSA